MRRMRAVRPFAAMLVVVAGLLGAVLTVLAPGGAQAQQPVAGTPSPTQVYRQRLDAVRIELDQLEAGLNRRGTSDSALQSLRQSIDPLAQEASKVAVELTPRADAIRSRLKELGPKPGDKDPPEGADVTKEREDRQTALADVDETVRIARSLLVQAEQIEKEIADRRRALFTQRLFESSTSLLSPQLWIELSSGLPHDGRALAFMAEEATDRAVEKLTLKGAVGVLGVLAVAVFLLVPVRRFGLAFVKRDRLAGQPNRLQKAVAAAAVIIASALGPMIAALILLAIVDTLSLFPPRVSPVFRSLVGGVVFIAFVRGLADGLLAPDRMNWRLVQVSEGTAQKLVLMSTAIASVLVVGQFTETTLKAIAASLRLTVATQGVFALLVTLILARALPLMRVVEPEDEAAFGPHVSERLDLTGIFRGIGWILVTLVVSAAALGYVAFASFLAEQFVWAAIVLPIITLCMILASEGIKAALGPETRLTKTLQASVGFRRGSLDQIAILAAGVARVALIVVAFLLLAAPWGVESTDVLSSMRAAFFGITIGGVTVSLSNVALAILFFAVGMFATRAVQRWLQREYLPHTHLDAGLRNSVTTGFGYLGVVAAAALSVSYLGLSFDKLTIVAGALSLGIGIGLQSIVGNFVSGLILLAERPVKVGDWIVVGDEQGYVKKINVRATQIETFDRATLIVPNSNLVSGVVKNWVHTDRVGRVIVTVPVGRDADADTVATIMRTCAVENADVLEDPAPRVLFKRMSETSLTFDLVCFVGEVDMSSRVQSDLTFAIVRRLREAGVIKPAGPQKLEIDGRVDLRSEMAEIRGARDARVKAEAEERDPDFQPPRRKDA